MPIEIWLLRCGHHLLQCGIDLEAGRLHRSIYYTGVHFHGVHFCGGVHFHGFTNFIAQLIHFGGTISFFSWGWHRSMVHPS